MLVSIARRWTLIDADVLILGGGIAGLACATALAKRGLRIVLLEKGAALGGRARSWRDERTGDRVDIGPHVILTEYPNFLSWLETLGSRDRVVFEESKLITLVSSSGVTNIRSRRLPAPLHLLPDMLSARDCSLSDMRSNMTALRLGMRFLERDVEPFDVVPARDLICSLGVSEHFANWFWRSATMALMNVPLEECSSGALFRLFSQFVGRPDGRFGFPDCALDELFLPAAERVIRDSGSEVRLDCAATALAHEGDACKGAITNDGSRISARHVVCALPPAELFDILPPEWRSAEPFADMEIFQPSPYVCTYLWFNTKLTKERFWTRTWTPEGFTYDSYDLSNIRRGWRDRGSVIASNMIHAKRAMELPDEEIVRITLEELAGMVPAATRERLVHHRVHRVPMAIPSPQPGTERLRPPTRTVHRGLLLAGDWTRTQLPCSMESAARSGFLAAEAILADEQKPAKLARLPRPPAGLVGLSHWWQGERPPLSPPL